MPIFDCKCTNCGKEKEYLFKGNETRDCFYCKEKSLKKVLSSPALLVTNFADKPSLRK